MTVLRTTIFGRSKYKPNTFIGGVSSFINTPNLVALALGISVNRIKAFSITGADIKFSVIGGTYVLGTSTNYFKDTSLTYFNDGSGLVTRINTANLFQNTQATDFIFPQLASDNHDSFRDNSKLINFYAPKMKTCGDGLLGSCALLTNINLQDLEVASGGAFRGNTSLVALNLSKLKSMTYYTCENNTGLKHFISSVQNITSGANFRNCTSIELIDIPKCVQLGNSPSVNSLQFQGIKTGCVINVNVALQTSNAGSPDADLVWVIANRGAIVNYIP